MKRFRFALERVLRQRALQEEVAEQALAAALRHEHSTQEACDKVQDQIRLESVRLANRLSAPMEGRDWLLHARFAAGLRSREAQLRRDRSEASARSRERRTDLMERRRAREVVSQLRRGAWERYREAATHEEQVTLDELAGQRHAQRGREREE